MRSGIQEESQDEFGDMESAGGSGEGRVVSPLLRRALDDSLQATQRTPMTIETEIARHTEAEMARCMEAELERRTAEQVTRNMVVFQRQLTGGHHVEGADPPVFFTETGRESQYADVGVVQGR